MDCFGKRFNRQQDWASPTIADTMCWPEVLELGCQRHAVEKGICSLDTGQRITKMLRAAMWHQNDDGSYTNGLGQTITAQQWVRMGD